MNYNLYKILCIFFLLFIYFSWIGKSSIYSYEHSLLNGKTNTFQTVYALLYFLLLATVIFYLILSQGMNNHVLYKSLLLGIMIGLAENTDYLIFKSEKTLQNTILQIIIVTVGIVASTEITHYYL